MLQAPSPLAPSALSAFSPALLQTVPGQAGATPANSQPNGQWPAMSRPSPLALGNTSAMSGWQSPSPLGTQNNASLGTMPSVLGALSSGASAMSQSNPASTLSPGFNAGGLLGGGANQPPMLGNGLGMGASPGMNTGLAGNLSPDQQTLLQVSQSPANTNPAMLQGMPQASNIAFNSMGIPMAMNTLTDPAKKIFMSIAQQTAGVDPKGASTIIEQMGTQDAGCFQDPTFTNLFAGVQQAKQQQAMQASQAKQLKALTDKLTGASKEEGKTEAKTEPSEGKTTEKPSKTEKTPKAKQEDE
jgi:hypothetical protein